MATGKAGAETGGAPQEARRGIAPTGTSQWAGEKRRTASGLFLVSRGMTEIGAPKRPVDWGGRSGEETDRDPLRRTAPLPGQAR